MEGNNLEIISGKEYTKDKINLIRRTVAKDASDDELAMYLHLAKTYELDPFLKEILFMKRKVWNDYKKGYDEVPTMMVTRDGHMSIAHKSGQFGGIKTTPNFDAQGKLLSATCKIWNKSCTEPIEVTVYFKEYCAYKKDGTPQALWGSKPITMLSKVAESQALRKAFNFHGIYSPEEMEAEIQKDTKTELEYMKDTIDVSEKLNADPAAAEKYAEEIKTKILDDIFASTTTEQLSHIKKQYEADIGRLMDEDRAYILGEFDSQMTNIISGPEIEIQGDGKALDRKTGQEVEIEAKVPETANVSEIQGKKDPLVELKAREEAGQAFLKTAVAELGLITTKAHLNVFKQKSVQNRMKMLPEQREYFDALLKEKFAKVK
jgi:phage recombination protein Bet